MLATFGLLSADVSGGQIVGLSNILHLTILVDPFLSGLEIRCSKGHPALSKSFDFAEGFDCPLDLGGGCCERAIGMRPSVSARLCWRVQTPSVAIRPPPYCFFSIVWLCCSGRNWSCFGSFVGHPQVQLHCKHTKRISELIKVSDYTYTYALTLFWNYHSFQTDYRPTYHFKLFRQLPYRTLTNFNLILWELITGCRYRFRDSRAIFLIANYGITVAVLIF